METPSYIKTLLKPTTGKSSSRKVWSIDLETTWLPFFTATNTLGDTAIPSEALGAPLRLAYNQDGSVKFSKAGRPVIKVAKDISDNVKLVRDNFIAGLQSYTDEVFNKNTEAYTEQVQKNLEAGKPIQAHDKAKLDEARQRLIDQALEQAEQSEPAPDATAKAADPDKERELAPV